MNVSGLSVLVGMGTAVSTICGQAYGAKNYRKVGETLQLGLLVFCVLPAPLPPCLPSLPPATGDCWGRGGYVRGGVGGVMPNLVRIRSK